MFFSFSEFPTGLQDLLDETFPGSWIDSGHYAF
jgi:hypothetical protein